MAERICLPMQEAQETWIQPLGWEDTLEQEMATHSSIIAWETPWTEEPHRLQSMASPRVRHDLGHMHTQSQLMQSEIRSESWRSKQVQAVSVLGHSRPVCPGNFLGEVARKNWGNVWKSIQEE